MICEPNLSLPQKINLDGLRKSEESNNFHAHQTDKCSDAVKYKITYIQSQYKVLPKFYDQFDHLNAVLSLQSNKYLRCRWNTFVDNVPEDYARIRLYCDYMKEKEVHFVRRKILNGNFYGVDNKLAPIPQLSDPRNIVKIKKE